MKCIQRSCCFGFSLEDGIMGIVVWDTLYCLFFLTTAINTMIYYYDNQQDINKSFTDIATACVLIIRASIGIRTSLKEFNKAQVKAYFITRLVWDAVILLLNITMAALRKITLQTSIANVLVVLIIDGYLNLIIFSYLRNAQSLLSGHSESDIEVAPKRVRRPDSRLDINHIEFEV